MARPSTACRRNLTPRTVLLALIFGTLLLMFAHGDIRIVVGRKNEEVLVVGVHRHRQPNVVEAPDDAPDIADDVNPAVVPPPVVVGGGSRARAAASAAAKKPVAGKPIEAPHGGDADHVAAAGAGGSADAANDHDGDGKDDGIVLPPGADWSEADIKSVPYQRTKPVTKRAAGLTQSEQQGFISRMKAGGYVKQHINATAPWPTLKQYPVNSELFLATCDVDSPTYQIDCGVITQMRKEVGLLDIALLNDQGVVKFKAQRKSGPVIGKKLRKRIMKRPGQGLTGRGWGIAGPFTNKWRFYERHLRAALAAEAQRATGAAHRAGETGLHLCEVGFLAGHSVAVYAGIVGRGAFSAVSVFDYPQPGPMYATVGSQHMRSRIEGAAERPGGRRPRFDFYAGNSRDLVPAAVRSGRLRQCDFVSLDGSKMVPDVVSDLRGLGRVAHAGTVVVMDDMWTTKVTAAAKAVAEGGARAVDLGEHNAAVGALVGLGVLEIVEVWHSDVPGWPAFGNLAIRYKLYGAELSAALDRVFYGAYPTFRPLSANATGGVSCDVAAAVGVPSQCCKDGRARTASPAELHFDGKALTPVNVVVSTDASGASWSSSVWFRIAEELVVSPAPSGVPPLADSCASHAQLSAPIINAVDNTAHLIAWAAARSAGAGKLRSVCIVAAGITDAAARHVATVAAVGNSNADSSSVRVSVIQPSSSPLPAHSKSAGVERFPFVPSAAGDDGESSLATLPTDCPLAVVDQTSWPTATVRRRSSALELPLSAILAHILKGANTRMVLLRKVNAAGILAASSLAASHGWPDGGLKSPKWAFDHRWAPIRESISSFGPLTAFEGDIAFGLAQGSAKLHTVDLLDHGADPSGGVAVLARDAKYAARHVKKVHPAVFRAMADPLADMVRP